MIRPSSEQQLAFELFLKEEGLRIDASAGSGKTTTLQMLAAYLPTRIEMHLSRRNSGCYMQPSLAQ
jgi:UDP-N-acetylmuramyl pentapeptide synthase